MGPFRLTFNGCQFEICDDATNVASTMVYARSPDGQVFTVSGTGTVGKRRKRFPDWEFYTKTSGSGLVLDSSHPAATGAGDTDGLPNVSADRRKHGWSL